MFHVGVNATSRSSSSIPAKSSSPMIRRPDRWGRGRERRREQHVEVARRTRRSDASSACTCPKRLRQVRGASPPRRPATSVRFGVSSVSTGGRSGRAAGAARRDQRRRRHVEPRRCRLDQLVAGRLEQRDGRRRTASRHAGSTAEFGSGCVGGPRDPQPAGRRRRLVEERPGRRREPPHVAGRGPGHRVEQRGGVRDGAGDRSVRRVPALRSGRRRHAAPRRLEAEERRTTPKGCGSTRRRRSRARPRTSPAASAAPAPPDDPPGVRSGSHGLRAGRVRGGLGRRARPELRRVRLSEDREPGAPDARDDLVVAVRAHGRATSRCRASCGCRPCR